VESRRSPKLSRRDETRDGNVPRRLWLLNLDTQSVPDDGIVGSQRISGRRIGALLLARVQ
jgi:hypothetical protein